MFVGVYTAFLLAQHRAAQDEEERRLALRRALAEEFDAIADVGSATSGQIDALRTLLREGD